MRGIVDSARRLWDEWRGMRGGEAAMTYLGDILPPGCWLWLLRSVHADADSEVQVLRL